MIEEFWKDVEGYESYYQISNLGRVKSLDRYIKNRYGSERLCKGKILNSKINKWGYREISLSKDNIQRTYRINRLVAKAFLDDYSEQLEVNHKDENKINDNYLNLEMMTSKENCNYGSRNEKILEKKQKAIIQLSKDNEFIKIWKSAKEIERQLHILHTSIANCCRGYSKTSGGYVWRYYKQ